MKGVEVPVVTGFIRAATQVWWEEQMEIFFIGDAVWVFIR